MFSEGIERDWYDEISFFHLIFDCTTAKLRLLLKRQPHSPDVKKHCLSICDAKDTGSLVEMWDP